MQYFPIFVDAKQLNVLVVGGGEVATRKVELMLKTPAKITVVSPDLSPSLIRLAQDEKIQHIQGFYQPELLEDKQLVFVATADSSLNKEISLDARAQGVLANVVDSPELCHFITPSIVDRSPMVFAISSEGQSPVLVRYWREKLETLLPQTLGYLAKFAGEKRAHIKQKLDNIAKRRSFWESFFSSSQAEDIHNIDAFYQQLVTEVDNNKVITGELYVINVPSDPDNLTLAALRHMQKSDIAIYQNDVKPAVLEMIRRDAEREAISDDLQNQIDTHLKDGLKVCYLSTNDEQEPIHLCDKYQNFHLKVFNCKEQP